MILLEHCLDDNYFRFQSQHYLHIDDIATGSPVAPVLADIWMEHFEEKALGLEPNSVRLWKRFEDDIFDVDSEYIVNSFSAKCPLQQLKFPLSIIFSPRITS